MDNIDEVFEHMLESVITAEELANIVKYAVDKQNEKEFKKAYIDIGVKQAEIIKRIFTNSVDEFYGSYSPTVYKRNLSLYDVLDIRFTDKGIVDTFADDYSDLYDESKMTTTRSGGSLFDTVFKQGYHGGASSISPSKAEIWGEHPSTGTPYYRRGGWVRIRGRNGKSYGFYHKYGKWGRAAEKADKSIYQMMIEDVGEAETGEMVVEFSKIVKEHSDAAIAAATPDINRAIEQYAKSVGR